MDKMFLGQQMIPSPAGQTPWLYGALTFYIPSTIAISEISEFLPNVSLRSFPSFSSETEVTYRVKKLYSWYVNTLLDQLFSICDFDEIAFIQSKWRGRALIDISFHHYDSYPALIFSGENMGIIHKLNADISIDPY